MDIEFAYKILPNAKVGIDGLGNDIGAYVKITLNLPQRYATTKYEEAHTSLLPFVAKQTTVDVSHLQPISMDEYEGNQ